MTHHKNGKFANYKEQVIDSYCYESGRDAEQVRTLLPYAETLSRLLFLQWLVERRRRGILGTTVGPVDALIPKKSCKNCATDDRSFQPESAKLVSLTRN